MKELDCRLLLATAYMLILISESVESVAKHYAKHTTRKCLYKTISSLNYQVKQNTIT